MRINWPSREQCEAAGLTIFLLGAALLMGAVLFFWLKFVFDQVRIPQCLRECPPPPRDLEAVRRVYEDDYRYMDRFCARCWLDYSKSNWDEATVGKEPFDYPWFREYP